MAGLKMNDSVSPEVSIVTTVYNEEACLPHFYDRLTSVLEKREIPYELVLVGDGSRDKSLATMRELASKDPRIQYLSLGGTVGTRLGC